MSTLQQQDKKPANPLKTLLDLGKSKGQLSSKEILDVLGDELDPEQIEKIYDALESNGIEIIEDTEDLSLDDLNITSTPQFEGKTLLETIVITYASKLDKIDIMLDEVRYYDTVIKMLIENELSNISYEDKKKALSYLKKTKYTLKSKDRLGREKTKYI